MDAITALEFQTPTPSGLLTRALGTYPPTTASSRRPGPRPAAGSRGLARPLSFLGERSKQRGICGDIGDMSFGGLGAPLHLAANLRALFCHAPLHHFFSLRGIQEMDMMSCMSGHR